MFWCTWQGIGTSGVLNGKGWSAVSIAPPANRYDSLTASATSTKYTLKANDYATASSSLQNFQTFSQTYTQIFVHEYIFFCNFDFRFRIHKGTQIVCHSRIEVVHQAGSTPIELHSGLRPKASNTSRSHASVFLVGLPIFLGFESYASGAMPYWLMNLSVCQRYHSPVLWPCCDAHSTPYSVFHAWQQHF